jgi:hypothetical protein
MPPAPGAQGGRSAQGGEVREVVSLVPSARRGAPQRGRQSCHRLDDDQDEDRNVGEPHDEFVAERRVDETQAFVDQDRRLQLGVVGVRALLQVVS